MKNIYQFCFVLFFIMLFVACRGPEPEQVEPEQVEWDNSNESMFEISETDPSLAVQKADSFNESMALNPFYVPKVINGTQVKKVSLGGYLYKNITLPEGVEEVTLSRRGSEVKKLVLSSTVKQIQSKGTIEEATYSGNNMLFKDRCFYSADGKTLFKALKSVPLQGNELVIPDTVETITSYSLAFTFADYSGEENSRIVVPSSVKQVDEYAFYKSVVNEIEFQGEDVTFGHNVFSFCSGLTEIPQIFLNSITFLEDSEFFECFELSEIELPESITEIKSGAFEGCTCLAGIFIPVSVIKLSSYIFVDCYNLDTLTYGGTQDQWRALAQSSEDEEEDWGTNSVVQYVVCSDGTLDLWAQH